MLEKATLTLAVLGALVVVLTPASAEAQLAGHNIKGDFGLQSGTQPAPGFYLAPMYLHYGGDTLRNKSGDSIGIDPDRRGFLNANVYSAGLWYVSEKKFLGANYGFLAFGTLTDNRMEIPIFDLQSKTDTGLTDLYFQPLNLGWHTPRASFTAGLGVFAPIGEYEPRGEDNLGMGMWSFEFYGGTTVYFDEQKSWHLATTAFYETHTKKRDTDIEVGDILTLEGGLGRSFMDGAVVVGLAYYAQWKVTDDDFGLDLEVPEGRRLGKHRVYGFGPEFTLPIATKNKLIALVTARYFWETGARTTVEGSTLLVSATFPVPSISLR